ncbi:MAG: penicillin-binding protein activator LpoB [Planctomycetes bacterium]|nr:penicillin-binding protein activator LpoB [Planctomycetota bacterium]
MFVQKNRCSLFVLFALVCLFAGCGTTTKRGSDDASLNDLALSRKLDLKDVDIALAKLMKEFEASRFVGDAKKSGERPGLAVDIIVNETDQHGINTDRLLESFNTKIVNMGTFSVVSMANLEKFKKLLLEQNTDWYDGATVPNAGNLYGFRFIIGGKLFGETEYGSGEARTQYRLVLKAMNVENGVIEWQSTADVTKYQS